MIKSPNLTVMLAAAEKAAHGIQRDFGEVGNLQVSRKGALDFVTQTDLRAEKIIHDELLRARPKFGFLLEEGGEIPGQDPLYRWVVDPLDGTTNFIHAIPYLCISIALEKKRADGEWETEAAVIYDPIHDDRFVAERGKGAFHNRQRMKVSSRTGFDEAMIITHSPKHDRENFRKSMQLYLKITEYSKGIRTMGATALDLCYLAAGRYDAGFYTSFKRWDIAAGLLIAQEAGAEITQLDGDTAITSPESLVIGNRKLQQSLLSILKPIWMA